MSELENYITHLESQNKHEPALAFLEDLVRDHDDQPLLKRTLAAFLHRMGRIADAVPILDQLGEVLIQKGDKQSAMEVINQIILMNPPNVQDYRALLTQMQSG